MTVLQPKYPSFVGSDEIDDFNTWIEKDIAKKLNEGRISFLFGSGMSAGSHLPLGFSLTVKILESVLGIDEKESQILSKNIPLEMAAEMYLKEKNKSDLEALLGEIFETRNVQPAQSHVLLEKVISYSKNKIRRLYTTNFDTLIEKQLSSGAINITSERPRDLSHAIDKNLLPIIHLHGAVICEGNALPRCAGIRITEGQIFSSDDALFALFKSDLLNNEFLFIGYSMSDPNLRSLYINVRRIIETREELDKWTYIIAPFEEELEGKSEEKKEQEKLVWRATKKIWMARHAKVIPLSAEDFLTILLNAIINFKQTQQIKQVAKRLDIPEELLKDRIKRLREIFEHFNEGDALDFIDEFTRTR